MFPLIDRFLAKGDVPPEETWRLLDWCAQHGADEFTVAMLALQGSPASFLDDVNAALNSFERPMAPRRRLTVLVGQPLVQPTKLWSLASASVAVLRRFFADGLFTYPTSEWEVGCLEDPTFYRGGEIICGIVSHEGEGMLRLTQPEHAEVAALGIRTRDQAQWI